VQPGGVVLGLEKTTRGWPWSLVAATLDTVPESLQGHQGEPDPPTGWRWPRRNPQTYGFSLGIAWPRPRCPAGVMGWCGGLAMEEQDNQLERAQDASGSRLNLLSPGETRSQRLSSPCRLACWKPRQLRPAVSRAAGFRTACLKPRYGNHRLDPAQHHCASRSGSRAVRRAPSGRCSAMSSFLLPLP